MLEIVKYNEDEYGYPALLVLGCFDAIHIGHLELLKKARLQAKINGLDLGVMIFNTGKGGKQVSTLDERLKLLEKLNVKFVLAIDFNDEFKATSAKDFLSNVESKINVKGYMSGKDFRFGAGAKGKSSTLKTYAEDEDNGVWYASVKDVVSGEEKVSTSLIKKYIEEGEIVKANELLGRPFSVTGAVVEGENRGRGLGFPTVNIEYPAEKVELKQGVYKVKCMIDETECLGIANYGPQPTFDDDRVVLEVHIDKFEGSLYGEVLTIEFCDYLRDIKKFADADELSAQLAADLEKAREE